MKNEKMQAIIEGYISAYNAMDVPGMLSYLHQDVVFHSVMNGQYNLSVNGIKEFEDLATHALVLFKSRNQSLTKVDYEGDTANAKIDYQGTLAVDMPTFGQAGETITFKGRSEFIFKDGLIHILTDIS